MSAAAQLPHAPAAQAPARPVGRVVELASGLLMLLDAHRITGRLPVDARAQVARLRHAVKLAVQTTAPTLMPAPAPAGANPAELLRGWLAAQAWARPDPGPWGWVYLLCFRDPATGRHTPTRAPAAVGSTPATTGAGRPTCCGASPASTPTRSGAALAGWCRSRSPPG